MLSMFDLHSMLSMDPRFARTTVREVRRQVAISLTQEPSSSR
jgi:hypothetical protein